MSDKVPMGQYDKWVYQTFQSQPNETYSHKEKCYNCFENNFFYIRKGTAHKDAGLICKGCGVVIS